MEFNWERILDRVYLVLLTFACLWWASRNSDPSKVGALEANVQNIVQQVNQFGKEVNGRLTDIEQKLPQATPKK